MENLLLSLPVLYTFRLFFEEEASKAQFKSGLDLYSLYVLNVSEFWKLEFETDHWNRLIFNRNHRYNP